MAEKDGSNLERMSIQFTARQRAFLESEADRLQISVSDQVRRIVDEFIDGLPAHHPSRRKPKDPPTEEPGAR